MHYEGLNLNLGTMQPLTKEGLESERAYPVGTARSWTEGLSLIFPYRDGVAALASYVLYKPGLTTEVTTSPLS